jgi:D-alanyl-D-alanine carboxypeptidase
MKGKNLTIPLAITVLVLLGLVIYLWFLSSNLKEEFSVLEKGYLAESQRAEEVRIELQNKLSETTEENSILLEALTREQDKNSEFEDQIREIAGTVGFLEKLATTDPELLQKYSKVYFLNEHYVPPKLSEIDEEYIYSSVNDLMIHAQVAPFLDDLLEEGDDDNIDLQVVSAFRSFGTQASLKSHYTVTYGAGTANQFSADQGYSEHQLGTTVDFTTSAEGTPFTSFEGTEAYKWLRDNAHRYGFVLSYPPNNSYYQFEPWHWRFVGKDLARDLHRDNEYFYDLNQRTIDEYLADIFD